MFGFLGPNGAGKTTTVRTLGTLIAPTSGAATVAGIPLTPENGVQIRQRISIMPESPGLYLRPTVEENLLCFADLFEVADVAARVEYALKAVDLTHRTHDVCGALSKGLRQRVALARSLLNDPEVLFLDEPTSGLDPPATRDVHDLIGDLRQRGVTIFLTTHRLEEAERLCDRVAIMNRTLRTIGRPEELRDRLFAKTLLVKTRVPLAEPACVFGGLPGVDGWHPDGPSAYVLSVTDSRVAAPAATRALVAAGADVLSLGELQHSLEDVYLELIETLTGVHACHPRSRARRAGGLLGGRGTPAGHAGAGAVNTGASRGALLAKALAGFVPSVAVAYFVFALFIAIVELFAQPGVASGLLKAPDIIGQLVFTPLLAAWPIWVGIGVSARSSDPRTAGQLSLLACLPTVAVTSLIAFDVIPATVVVAGVFGIALLLLDRIGWRMASAIFDRERLMTNTR